MKRTFAGLMFVRRLEGKAILCAVIDCPPESKLQDEALHPFAGIETDTGIALITSNAEAKSIRKYAQGNSIDGLLTSPIWKTGTPKELPQAIKNQIIALLSKE